MLVNLIVTLSNIFGIYPIVAAIQTQSTWLIALMIGTVLASVMMHVTETKHGLPGIMWQKYSSIFLNIDRLTAILSTVYSVYKLYVKWQVVETSVVIFGCIGVLSMFVSENVVKSQFWFMITHSIWHWIAYCVLARLIVM